LSARLGPQKRWVSVAGALAAALIVAGALAHQYQRHDTLDYRLGRYRLWAFDSYVYVAMAEQPRFFTVAPWGYRVLTPLIVNRLPIRNVVRGFRVMTLAGLGIAGILFYFFLRHLGHHMLPSLLAVAAFCLSSPIAASVRDYVNVDPWAIALQMAFFIALERRSGVSLLAFLGAMLSLGKETGPLLLPLVFLSHRAHGYRRALGATVAVGFPMLVLMLSLRLWWTPHIHTPHAPLDLETARAGFRVLIVQWNDTWPALILHGIMPLALLGALRAGTRSFVIRYGYLILVLEGVALFSWLNVPSNVPSPHYGDNAMRLALYPLPLLLALALHAVDPIFRWGRRAPGTAPRRPRTIGSTLGSALATVGILGCLALPFISLDRYRRVPLHHRRDGPLILTVCRESLRTARRLAAGKEIAWDLDKRGYVPGDNPRDMPLMRWYLREGWNRTSAYYGSDPVMMKGPAAVFLLPSLDQAPLELVLTVSGSASANVVVNGVGVGALDAIHARQDHALRIPRRALFRGDNIVELRRTSAEGSVMRLHSIAIYPVNGV
jgi:hypothetical protein